jgi:hypothetical protein
LLKQNGKRRVNDAMRCFRWAQKDGTLLGLAETATQSSRDTFSRRSWACWASTVIVAIGRAISRPMPIGSPVTSH